RHVGDGCGGTPRVTVVLDRRQSERRETRGPHLPVAAERRRRGDRRTPPTDEDGPRWATLGFRPHRRRSLAPLCPRRTGLTPRADAAPRWPAGPVAVERKHRAEE